MPFHIDIAPTPLFNATCGDQRDARRRWPADPRRASSACRRPWRRTVLRRQARRDLVADHDRLQHFSRSNAGPRRARAPPESGRCVPARPVVVEVGAANQAAVRERRQFRRRRDTVAEHGALQLTGRRPLRARAPARRLLLESRPRCRPPNRSSCGWRTHRRRRDSDSLNSWTNFTIVRVVSSIGPLPSRRL